MLLSGGATVTQGSVAASESGAFYPDGSRLPRLPMLPTWPSWQQDAGPGLCPCYDPVFCAPGHPRAAAGVGVVMLWLLRRSVIQEVSEVVAEPAQRHYRSGSQNSVGDPRFGLYSQPGKRKSAEINNRTNRFQEEAVTQKAGPQSLSR